MAQLCPPLVQVLEGGLPPRGARRVVERRTERSQLLSPCCGSPADPVGVRKGKRLGGGWPESPDWLPACLETVRTWTAPAGLCAEGRTAEGQEGP